jgi:nicotinamidase-related amidase
VKVVNDVFPCYPERGAFASTDLEGRLKAKGVTQVVLAGVATGTCVEATARQAHEQGFNVTLALDAMNRWASGSARV